LKIKKLPKFTSNDRNIGHKFTCRAEELSAITFAASLRARDAFCSPSAAITYNIIE